MKRLFLLVILCPVLTIGQVKKCTIDGQIVYSDSQCGQQGAAVNVTPNSIDASNLRAQEEKAEKQKKQSSAAASANAKKSANEQFKQRQGLNGPCPGLDHEAYLSCMKRAIKPMPKVR